MRNIATLDLGLVGTIVNRPWFKEGARAAQWGHLWALSDISRQDIELAKTLAHQHWLINGVDEEVFSHIDEIAEIDSEFAKQLVGASWFVDGVTEEENQSLFDFRKILRLDVQLARRLLNYRWVTDDLTVSERETLEFLSLLTKSDPTGLQPVVDAAWFVDGVSDQEYVRLALGLPSDAGDITSELSDALRHSVLDSLNITAKVSLDSLRSLSTKSWATDGLDREEAAFVIAISRVPIDSPTLYQRLIDSHYTQADSVSLPLAGDVKVWGVFGSTLQTRRGLCDPHYRYSTHYGGLLESAVSHY